MAVGFRVVRAVRVCRTGRLFGTGWVREGRAAATALEKMEAKVTGSCFRPSPAVALPEGKRH